MVQPAHSSASLAMSRSPRNGRGPWAAPAGYTDARVPAKTTGGSRTLAAASVISRPVTAAEVAQARAFENLLQAESAELNALTRRVAGAADQQLATDGSAPTWDLMQLRVRMDEVQRLLQALRGRFPRQLPETTR